MYQYKEKYIIDFTDVKSYLDMHFIIRDALDWPDYYGCNFDALWDCLKDMIGDPIHIEILGLDVVERSFGDCAGRIIETFRELKHYRNDKYSHEIQIEIVSGDIRIALE